MRFIRIATVLLFLAPALSTGTELVPDWRLATADGGSIRLSQEVQEQPVILFFWATWCPYCKALMPHLQSIKLELGDDIEILAINFRDKGDPVAFVEAAGYDFIVLPNGDDVAELYGIHGTPGVMIVDSEQVLRFDLRALPQREIPSSSEKLSNSQKAAYRAPYWAAEIRRSLDAVLEGEAD